MKNSDVLKKVYGFFIPIAWKRHKGYFAANILKLLVNTIRPFIAIYFIPAIVAEMMGEGRGDVLVKLTLIMVLAEFVVSVLSGLMNQTVERYGQLFENYFNAELSKRIMELDFQLTEDKKALDQLELARNGMSWYSGGMNGLMNPFFDIISGILTIAGTAYLLATKAPIALLIAVVVVVVSTIFTAKINKIEQEFYKKLSGVNRAFGYFGWGLSDIRYGKDIRLYGAKDMMVEKWNSYTDEQVTGMKEMSDKKLPYNLAVTGLSNVLQDCAIYFYLGFLAVMGKILVPSCIQLISSASTFTGAMRNVMTNYLMIVQRANYAQEFVKFMDYPVVMREGKEKVGTGMHTFEFRNVTFRYPGSEVTVLRNLNLTISEGEHLSVVGLNGAGKTTLVKLLCRLYDPNEGEILMDGINIKAYDYEEYMKVFAPVFQDFRLFAFTIKENILLKDEISEEEKNASLAIIKKTGLEEKIKAFPNGIDTILFRHFDKYGVEPSGGEQQKLAISRALYKDAPVVILDEPTAALDPIAEYEIYRQFEDLVRGKTAIYISHRLSSCQFCDRIAVFSEGSVKECGTHAELVNLPGGLYAKMFSAQARYYRKEGAS